MTTEANKAIVRRFQQAVLNGRDIDVLDEIVAEDYVDHAAFPGQEPGRRGVKRRISYLLAALDPRWTEHDFIAEDDLVVARWSLEQSNVETKTIQDDPWVGYKQLFIRFYADDLKIAS